MLNDYSVNSILREKFEDDFLDNTKKILNIRIRSKNIEAMIKYIRIRIGNLREEPNFKYQRISAKYLSNDEDFRSFNLYMNYALRLSYEGKELSYDSLSTLFSIDLVKKFADILEVSTDLLVIGTDDKKAQGKMKDSELLSMFTKAQRLMKKTVNV